jgi:hypothetical protein
MSAFTPYPDRLSLMPSEGAVQLTRLREGGLVPLRWLQRRRTEAMMLRRFHSMREATQPGSIRRS